MLENLVSILLPLKPWEGFLCLVLYTGGRSVEITSVQSNISPIGLNSGFLDCFFLSLSD